MRRRAADGDGQRFCRAALLQGRGREPERARESERGAERPSLDQPARPPASGRDSPIPNAAMGRVPGDRAAAAGSERADGRRGLRCVERSAADVHWPRPSDPSSVTNTIVHVLSMRAGQGTRAGIRPVG